jgi:malonyl CoA-acyl carrier protein transacylase/nucleoside-diphosphate-sugar epimerase
VALIKTLLVIAKGAIPPQASFRMINPGVHALPSDKIEIATTLKPWKVDFRAALINNYGASGSNASLIITQTPSSISPSLPKTSAQPSGSKYPFWLCGFDDQSLRRYAARLLELLKSKTISENELSLANLSFQMYRQSNRSLGQALLFSSSSIQDLEDKLTAFGRGDGGISTTSRPLSTRPVILCFGGQISTSISLDREVYNNVKILRSHLDHCNEICMSLGLESIYPEIFQKTPITDIVKLQTMLFALQYSCAKSWIDSGVQVAAVVGHSFGELTAMCISGVLTVKDTVKMIAGRARIVRDKWGTEKGAMMAVEANFEDVEKLLSETSKAYPEEPAATIACFNSPRSFTLAGSSKSIDNVQELGKNKAFASIKTKRLNVTNSFHSRLVDPLMLDLQKVGETVVFRDPTIPLERATKEEAPARISSTFVASHMRDPVYFNHAIQRLSRKYPSAIFLEAGSNSTITNMASRALASPKEFHFQPVNITTDSAFQFLSDATLALWKEGLNISFWAHHPIQTPDYSLIFLPPYQFEKARHWMELKKPRKVVSELPAPVETIPAPNGLWTFMGYLDAGENSVRFRVNTMNDKYQGYVSAHVIAQTAPICPSTFQLVIAIDALASLVVGDAKTSNLSPELRGMDSHSPMVMNDSKVVWFDAERHQNNPLAWDWKMISANAKGDSSDETLHVSGRIVFRHVDDAAFKSNFARYERLVGRRRCLDLLDGNQADGVIQGSRNIYKAFAEIVQYNDEVYKGLQKIAGTETESAGRIKKQHRGETWLDLGLADSFCQVAGIFLNSMTDHSDNEMYISDKIDHWVRSPRVSTHSQPETWEVFACHQSPSEKEYISDVFAFDPRNGQLVEVILGIHYVRVSKTGMGKLLSRLSPGSKVTHTIPASAPAEIIKVNGVRHGSHQKSPDPAPELVPKKHKEPKKKSPGRDIEGPTRSMLCNLSGLEPEEVKTSSDLADLGIDSLMGMELAREVEGMFKITLDTSDLLDLTDFQSLINCIKSTLGITDDGAADEYEEAGTIEEKPYLNGVTPKINGEVAGNGKPATNGVHSYTNGDTPSSAAHSGIPARVILDIFGETKQATDRFMEENGFSGYAHHVLPKSTEMCVVYILDAFEELGCSLRTAKPGQVLDRIQYLPRHEQCVEVFYDILEKARLVDLDGPKITRTAIVAPKKSAQTLLEELLRDSPIHGYDHKLTAIAGRKLADCLMGKVDGVQLIFGDPNTKEVVSGMYGKSPINVAWIKQMEEFLTRFLLHIPKQEGPIKILEMGAGTGGTTAKLLPLLASLGVLFEYTVTDLSASLVAAARKRFKHYPFVKFKVLDIEQEPTGEFIHSQHLVIATNCVHATHSLVTSTKNIHSLLRPDGLLMMLEMTETLPWIDLVFGLLEGWWLFDDGRKHALAPPEVWEKTLKSVGYGHVDWTDGNLPETAIQRIIIALASGPSYDRVPTPPKSLPSNTTDFNARQVVVDSFIEKYNQGFLSPDPLTAIDGEAGGVDECVLVTGATGSLGSHLVAYFACRPNVKRVICLNRPNNVGCIARQRLALESRGLFLNSGELSKLKVLESDTSKPKLGLTNDDYTKLVNSVTNIVHNAWPMSITRQINAFESQFKAMRNLIDLAQECSAGHLRKRQKIGFQFISSIATVGCHPFVSGEALVPEEKMTVDSVMPTGYGDAKLVCERLLDETLHKYPSQFRPMVVRIAQIAGSKTSGHWNPVEHLAFLIKSCQTLKAIPDLQGVCISLLL